MEVALVHGLTPSSLDLRLFMGGLDTREAGKEQRPWVHTGRVSLWRESLEGSCRSSALGNRSGAAATGTSTDLVCGWGNNTHRDG